MLSRRDFTVLLSLEFKLFAFDLNLPFAPRMPYSFRYVKTKVFRCVRLHPTCCGDRKKESTKTLFEPGK